MCATQMALNIKNQEVERLADELGRRTGETKAEGGHQGVSVSAPPRSATAAHAAARGRPERDRSPLREPAGPRFPNAGGDSRLRRPGPAALMAIDTSAVVAIAGRPLLFKDDFTRTDVDRAS